MSDHWLQYVPKVPTFRPTPEAAERATALLSSFLAQAESIKARFEAEVRFFDPGANWSGVLCPCCGADAEHWWGQAMASGFENGFQDLRCVALRCGATTSLDRLRYRWPAAFGCFVLEALNPNARGLPAVQLAQLQTVLGCELVEIPRHL